MTLTKHSDWLEPTSYVQMLILNLIPNINKFPTIIKNSLNNSYLNKTLKSVLRIAKYNLLKEFEIAPKWMI